MNNEKKKNRMILLSLSLHPIIPSPEIAKGEAGSRDLLISKPEGSRDTFNGGRDQRLYSHRWAPPPPSGHAPPPDPRANHVLRPRVVLPGNGGALPLARGGGSIRRVRQARHCLRPSQTVVGRVGRIWSGLCMVKLLVRGCWTDVVMDGGWRGSGSWLERCVKERRLLRLGQRRGPGQQPTRFWSAAAACPFFSTIFLFKFVLMGLFKFVNC